MIVATKYLIHKEGRPMYGDHYLAVRIEDEGGGPFLIIDDGDNEARLDLDRWDELAEAVAKLRADAEHFEAMP